MLIQFTVGNFLSIKEKKTLSMEAAPIKDEPKENVITVPAYKITRSAAIYGANSSGKSNFIRAFERMKNLLQESVKLNNKEELNYTPFLLSTETSGQPTHFEIVWLYQGKRFRYGFEYTQQTIVGEWLFIKEPRKKEKNLFIRTPEGIGVNTKNFPEGKDKEELTNDNRLFLSLVAQLGGLISKEIMHWFDKDLTIISGLSFNDYEQLTKRLLLMYQDNQVDFKILYNDLQLGFKDLQMRETTQIEEFFSNFNTLSKEFRDIFIKQWEGNKAIDTYSIHNKYDKKGNIIGEVLFKFEENESAGTQKLIHILGPLLLTLTAGGTMVIDELDAKMHPLISQYIIKMFTTFPFNQNNPQLIFTTHDTHLLSAKLLRRDQIWFTEKNPQEETDLYSLTDIVLPDGTKPRNDSNYEKNYINGRYGAIPFIANL